jgi:hypothetical protein
MRKILVAFDGLKYSHSTQQYAMHIAKQANAHLVGVFLEDFTYHSYKIFQLAGDDGFDEEKLEVAEARDKELRSEAIDAFTEACKEANLSFTVHRDRSIAIQEILHESIFADLLIVNKNETLTHFEEKPPSNFMDSLLSQIQCPVVVVPDQYEPFRQLLLLYDGNPSSVFAIRTCSYLLSGLKALPVEVVSVMQGEDYSHPPDSMLMKEFMKRHFPNASYKVLKGLVENEIVDYVKTKGNDSLVVLGAYKRGAVSRWFRASMAAILMKESNAPLFIAHNK